MVSGTLIWRRLCKMAVILFEWWPDSFASKLQRGRAARDVYAQQVRIRQLCGHAPERERDDAGGYLAHTQELLGAYSEGGMRAVSTRHDACGSS